MTAAPPAHPTPPALAVLFPGQGSIGPGAGRPWVEHPAWAAVARVEEAAERPIAPLLLDAPAEALAPTDAAQLATLALSLVAWRALQGSGALDEIPLAAVAGHSLGQVTALIATGVLSEEEGLRLAVARADACRAADDAVPGRLAALLGADVEQAAAACAAAPGACWVANDNAPGQVVIGGTLEGLATAIEAATALGVRRAMPLAVGGAFHTPLLAPAAEALRPLLAATTYAAPSVTVVDNTDVDLHDRADPGWADRLARHLVEPVRWREVQETLVAKLGVSEVVELAPAGTLTALARRTIPGAATRAAADIVGVG